jgi:hypothetical protein
MTCVGGTSGAINGCGMSNRDINGATEMVGLMYSWTPLFLPYAPLKRMRSSAPPILTAAAKLPVSGSPPAPSTHRTTQKPDVEPRKAHARTRGGKDGRSGEPRRCSCRVSSAQPSSRSMGTSSSGTRSCGRYGAGALLDAPAHSLNQMPAGENAAGVSFTDSQQWSVNRAPRIDIAWPQQKVLKSEPPPVSDDCIHAASTSGAGQDGFAIYLPQSVCGRWNLGPHSGGGLVA